MKVSARPWPGDTDRKNAATTNDMRDLMGDILSAIQHHMGLALPRKIDPIPGFSTIPETLWGLKQRLKFVNRLPLPMASHIGRRFLDGSLKRSNI
jgi:hypothetical protein